MVLINPGDYWIVAVTTVCILLIASRKLTYLALVITATTSGIIFRGYGLFRLILHVVIVAALIYVVQLIFDKSKQSA